MPEQQDLISRRDAIRYVTALLGGAALVGGDALLTVGLAAPAVGDAGKFVSFSAAEIAVLDEIADTILPETATPGARAAGVGAFIARMVTDAYSPDQQLLFRDGLKALNIACRARCGADFVAANPTQRLALLEQLDREQVEATWSGSGGAAPHYFRMMKELTLLGYFTSEIGYTMAMRYVETPGRYDPCIPYAVGDRTWAKHA